MHPELFSLGGITLYSYGLMIAIGILLAYFIAEKRVYAIYGNPKQLEWLTFSLLAGGFLGSKILYILTRLQDIPSDPSILYNLGDGWVVYGGIIGGLAGGYLYCRAHKLNFLEYADMILPVVALAQGFGRIGCFLAGCCYGVEMDGWFTIVFPQGSLAPAGVHLFPSQLVMAVYDFGLYFLLSWLWKKRHDNGVITAVYLACYGVGRFVIEFFRGDLVRGSVGSLSTSQFISLFIVAAAALLLWFSMTRLKQSIEPNLTAIPSRKKDQDNK